MNRRLKFQNSGWFQHNFLAETASIRVLNRWKFDFTFRQEYSPARFLTRADSDEPLRPRTFSTGACYPGPIFNKLQDRRPHMRPLSGA